jgi:hypothetical protein
MRAIATRQINPNPIAILLLRFMTISPSERYDDSPLDTQPNAPLYYGADSEISICQIILSVFRWRKKESEVR